MKIYYKLRTKISNHNQIEIYDITNENGAVCIFKDYSSRHDICDDYDYIKDRVKQYHNKTYPLTDQLKIKAL